MHAAQTAFLREERYHGIAESHMRAVGVLLSNRLYGPSLHRVSQVLPLADITDSIAKPTAYSHCRGHRPRLGG